MTALRLAARLARREVVRRPWRTLLVALMVAIPVAGMTMAATVVRTVDLDRAEQFALENGGADVVVDGTPSISLPAGSESVSFRSDWVLARTTDDRRYRGVVTDLPLTSPIGAAMVRITDGRAPGGPSEVLLSPSAARKLDASVGDTLTFDRPAPTTLTVTGIGERRSDLGERMIVFADASDWPQWHEEATRQLAIDLPDSMTDGEVTAFLDGLVAQGVGSSAAAWQTGGADSEKSVRWSWVVGAVMLAVFGIVIASAFAAGARRQLATLGQLAANGGSPRVLRQVLFLQGTWTGVIGSVLGLGLGGIGLVALAPHIDRLVNMDVGPWKFDPTDVIPVMALGVLAATVAALVPARTTSRVPVLAALAGRRPLGRVPRRVTAGGLAIGVGGLALLGLAVFGSNNSPSDVWALTAIVGGVGILCGACAVTPRYVSVLEPAAGRVTGSWRLAARSLARQRTRTAAVVSGVCAAAALAVTASSLVLTIEANKDDSQQRRPDLVFVWGRTWREPVAGTEPAQIVRPVDDTLVDEIHDVVPEAEVVRVDEIDMTRFAWPEISVVRSNGASRDDSVSFNGRFESIAIADDAMLDVYQLGDEARSQLRDTGALLLAQEQGTATVTLRTLDGSDNVSFDATMLDNDLSALGLPPLLLDAQFASEIGLTTVSGSVAFDLPRSLTEDQSEGVSEAIDIHREDAEFAAGRALDTYIDAQFYWPSSDASPLLFEALLSAGALLFTLFVVAVSLALAAAETRDERDVLAVVGAPPRVMRRTSSRKAVLLAGLGAVLAIPVGFLPVVVFALAVENPVPLVFPWRTVFVLAVVVPLIAGAVTSFGSAVALRLRPVRVSSMAFE